LQLLEKKNPIGEYDSIVNPETHIPYFGRLFRLSTASLQSLRSFRVAHVENFSVRDVPKGIPNNIGCGFIIRQPAACEMETDRGGWQIPSICVGDATSQTTKKSVSLYADSV